MHEIPGQMRRFILFSFVAVVGLGNAQAEDWNGYLEDSTLIREREGSILSVYPDVRMTSGNVQPGLIPVWPHAQIGLDLSNESWRWSSRSPIAHPPGQPTVLNNEEPREQRRAVRVRYAQGLPLLATWGWGIELDASYVNRTVEFPGQSQLDLDRASLTDPGLRLLLPLYQGRYLGFVAAVGARAPLGDKTDWIGSHGAVSYTAGLRASAAIPWGVDLLSATASTCLEVAPNAQHQFPSDRSIEVTSQDSSVISGVALRHRLDTWFAYELRQEVLWHHFDQVQVVGSPRSSTEDLYYAPVTLSAILGTPWTGFFTVGVGTDPMTAGERRVWAWSTSYEVSPW